MDGDDLATKPALEPLQYHRAIAQYLREHEPEVWAWTASQAGCADQANEVRAALLRETYRLDPASHPDVHADCATVMTALGLDAPVALYQAADGAARQLVVWLSQNATAL